MAGPVRIAILADGKGARREFDQTSRSARSMGSVIGKAGRVAAVGLAAGLGAAALAAAKFAEGAAEDQTATALLARSLKNSAGATKAQISATENYITAQGKLYGVTDDDLRPALSRLVTASGSVKTALEDATRSENAAVGTGKSLEQVTTAIAKARNGSLGGLSRLGVATKDASGKSLTLDQVLANLDKKFKGAAATGANTLQGRINRLKVLASETGETIGYKLLPPLSDIAFKAADAGDGIASFVESSVGPKIQQLTDYIKDNRGEISRLADTARDELVPFLSEAAELALDAGTAFGKAAIPVARELVPALADIVGYGTDVLSFLNGLPGPVKTIGVEAGLAALVLPKLAAGIASVTATAKASSLGSFVTSMRAAETQADRTRLATAKIGAAARTAAGVGGLVLLTEGAKQSNDALSDLELVAGGIATGAAFGGLPGAVVGGIGGAFAAVKKASDNAGESFQLAKPKAESYAEALDKVSGAAKGSANEIARLSLQQSGALEAGKNLGISSRDLVKYVLGNEGAIKRVDAAMAAATQTQVSYTDGFGVTHTYLTGQQIDVGKLSTALGVNVKQLDADKRAAQDAAIANGTLSRALKGVKDRGNIVTRVEAKGYPETARQVANLTRGISLTPKELRTVIKATGAEASVKDVQRVIDKITAANKTKGDLPAFGKGVKAAVNEADAVASQGGARLANTLRTGTGKSKADLGGFKKSLSSGIGQAQATASTGGLNIGSALKSGVLTGFAGTEAVLSQRAAAAVRAAITAARAAGDIHSPSGETEKIGKALGDGLTKGMSARKAAAASGGADLVSAALLGLFNYAGTAAVGNAGDAINTTADTVTSLIEKTFATKLAAAEKRLRKKLKGKAEDKAIGKADKASAKAQRASLASLKDEYAALRRNAAQHDAIAQRLEEASASYDTLVQQAQDYANTVRDAIVASGSVIGLGEGDGFGSVDQLITQLRAKVASAQAYSQTIQALTAAGLNQTTLQQLIDAGVEGGIGTAQAILNGGPAAIGQINTLTGQLVATGTQLGATTSNNLYGAGVQAAAGLVAGLQSQQAAVEAAATALGDALARAIRKALKIKSPSQVFRDIGDNTVKGLALGLDETYVKRQGTRLASALEGGFASPALAPFMSASASGAGSSAMTVTLTAQEVDQLSRGKAIRLDLDAWDRVGGRPSS